MQSVMMPPAVCDDVTVAGRRRGRPAISDPARFERFDLGKQSDPGVGVRIVVAVTTIARVTLGKRIEDQQGGDPRTIIRTFWKVEIKGLRDRFDAERLRQNLGPVSNKEIAKATGIPESTLSELMTSKRDMVPDWDERVSLIVDYLGGGSQEWVAKWRKARAAYDSLGKNGEPPPLSSVEPQQPRKTKSKQVVIALGALILILAAGISVVVIATKSGETPGFDPGIQPTNNTDTQPANAAGAQCIRVRDETETVSVFKDPRTYDKWTEWPSKTRFRADIDASNPRRYRVLLKNGQYGYVNTNKQYVITDDDCP
jgi:hypothetical protein